MNTKTDGGPAFPTIESIDNNCIIRRGIVVHDINGQNGMTLRDWFAGMALQGILSTKASNVTIGDVNSKALSPMEAAYVVADGMLEVREK